MLSLDSMNTLTYTPVIIKCMYVCALTYSFFPFLVVEAGKDASYSLAGIFGLGMIGKFACMLCKCVCCRTSNHRLSALVFRLDCPVVDLSMDWFHGAGTRRHVAIKINAYVP